MKALVSGGRTGGHLIPGIAIYEELRSRKIETKYVMSQFDLKFPITTRVNEIDRILLDIKNISRKLSLKTPVYILKILRTFFYVFKIIKKYNPDLIIMTGGYISNPVALSAVLLRKPLFIAEQNSVSGITNRMFAGFARKIFTSFPNTGRIPQKKTILTGNPSIFKKISDQKTARAFFNLDHCDKIIGITGGSQGASKINDSIIDLLPYIDQEKIGLIWSIGAVDYNRLQSLGILDKITKNYNNVRLFQFIERMDLFFSSIDMVISRAGATSIAEFINFTMPSILIPIKNSPDNHQYLNALYLSQIHAARIVTEDELSEENLKNCILDIYHNLKDYQTPIAKLKTTLYQEKPEKKIIDFILNQK